MIGKFDMRVQTGANSGLANPVARVQKYQQLLGLMNTPGVNARYILEQYFANMLGSDGANRALLPEGADSQPQQRREAMIETACLGREWISRLTRTMHILSTRRNT